MALDTLPSKAREPRARPAEGRTLTAEQAARIHRIQRTGAYILLVLCSAAFLLPLLWMFTTSLKGEASVLEFPPRFIPNEFHWENYTNASTALASCESCGAS